MDSKTDENQKKWSGSILSAYWKPIGSILNFQKFKIKNLKKTRLHFKNCGQIQKFVVLRPEKIEEGAMGVKIEKTILTSSF
jgi:translation initiation factor IF-3